MRGRLSNSLFLGHISKKREYWKNWESQRRYGRKIFCTFKLLCWYKSGRSTISTSERYQCQEMETKMLGVKTEHTSSKSAGVKVLIVNFMGSELAPLESPFNCNCHLPFTPFLT